MILVIDNYDSFTYNLVHIVARCVDSVRVVRNDSIAPDEIARLRPDGILISPGPGKPSDAGISERVIRDFGASLPILGVCLGHQAIGEVYGGQIVHAPTLMHGKTSEILHDGTGLFSGIPNGFVATRYHSLVIDANSIPDELQVSAKTADGVVMGVRHRSHPVVGIQFHPESILTTEGERLIGNWLRGIGVIDRGLEPITP